MSYTLEKLREYVNQAEASIEEESLPKLNKTARIAFTCKCGNKGDKSFVRITFSGVLCASCTSLLRSKKREATNMERYGNTCSLG